MTVDDFLGGGFMDGSDGEEEDEVSRCRSYFSSSLNWTKDMADGDSGEEDEEEEDFADDASFASIDELDGALR
jgi:hypothetical protein